MKERENKIVLLQERTQVAATGLDSGWDVSLELGLLGDGGAFKRYMSAAEARTLAAALIAAADHYDAETARLAADQREVA